jgi:transcriptional regulator with XRE-family HTH domain
MVTVMEFDLKIFSERLNSIIREKELTFVSVARELNVSRSAVSQMRNGDIAPSMQTLFKLCQLLDVSADWLLGLRDTAGA